MSKRKALGVIVWLVPENGGKAGIVKKHISQMEELDGAIPERVCSFRFD